MAAASDRGVHPRAQPGGDPLGVVVDVGTPRCPHCDATSGGAAHCSTCGRSLAICGGFVLGAELDRGGVARIHAASAPGGFEAAVKLMERTPLHSLQVHQLFARSARLLGGLAHPGLPRVLGFERTACRSFLAMERLRGGTLWARVAPGQRRGGLAIDALLRGLLETAAFLHARGLVHGDVTPRNVMFRAEGDGRPVLVDFDGLCTVDERDVASLVMTRGYTAPEQCAGRIGVASDLYGIGATVVFAATGECPDRLERRGPHADLDLQGADVTPATRALLQRLVALDPNERPRSAQAAIDALSSRRRARAVGAKLLVAAALVVLFCMLAIGALTFAGATGARPM
ncbi:MAG: serine/threonine-protein kinase [Polyangiales bacterium]